MLILKHKEVSYVKPGTHGELVESVLLAHSSSTDWNSLPINIWCFVVIIVIVIIIIVVITIIIKVLIKMMLSQL